MTTKKAFHTSNLPENFKELVNQFSVDPVPSDTIESRIQQELSKSFTLLSEDVLDNQRITRVNTNQYIPKGDKIASMARSELANIIYANESKGEINIKQDRTVPPTMDFFLPLFAYSAGNHWCSIGYVRHESPWSIEFDFMGTEDFHLRVSEKSCCNSFGVASYTKDSYHKGVISANYIFRVKFELKSKAPIKTDIIKTNDLAINAVSRYFSLFSQATKDYKSIQSFQEPEIGVLWVPKIDSIKVDILEPQYKSSALVMTIGKDRYVIGYQNNST